MFLTVLTINKEYHNCSKNIINTKSKTKIKSKSEIPVPQLLIKTIKIIIIIIIIKIIHSIKTIMSHINLELYTEKYTSFIFF